MPYTKQQVKDLIDKLPNQTIQSLIKEMVYWEVVKGYCDGITAPQEDFDYQKARNQEIVRRGEQAVELLIPLLKHSDYEVREYAVEMLGDIQSSLAVPSLIALLTSDDSNSMKSKAAITLERIGNPEGVAAAKTWRRQTQ